MAETKNIGIKVKPPKKTCSDSNCPFHGTLLPRGRTFTGTIIAKDLHKTATVEWTHRHFIQKYERHIKKRTKIHVHNPECINANIGDIVKIAETRPISKTKNFVIIENLGKEKGFVKKLEAMEEAKEIIESKEREEKKPSNESEDGLEKSKTSQKEETAEELIKLASESEKGLEESKTLQKEAEENKDETS